MAHHHHLMNAAGFSGLFLLGLLNSLHCVGMCAPLSLLFINPETRRPSLPALLFYHTLRILSYASVGFLIHQLSFQIDSILNLPLFKWGMISIIALFLFTSTFAPPAWTSKFQSFILKRTIHWGPQLRASILGLMTPMLPCGLLYGALGASLMAPSSIIASIWMLGFGLGTVPLLFVGQVSLNTIKKYLGYRGQKAWILICSALTLGMLVWMNL